MDGADYIKLLGIIAGIIASLAGVAKILIKNYYDKEQELIVHRESSHKRTMKDINQSIADLRSTVGMHTEKMTEFKIALEKNYYRYEAQSDSIKVLATDFKDFSKEFKQDMGIVRSVVVKLGHELMLIKGKTTPK